MAATERLLERTSPNLDAIIDRYVQTHMFDDDLGSAVDPTAAAYVEAYHDAVTKRHPAALREITADVLQQQQRGDAGGIVAETSSSDDSSSSVGDSFGALLTGAIALLQKRAGLSEMAATVVLASAFVLAGPSAFLLGGMMVGGISKRNMNKVFKKRYGDTYSVDATVKREPVVEAPPDEDDDDENEDEDKDDDDDDKDDDKDEK